MMLEAYDSQTWDEAEEHAANLHSWLERSGFTPHVVITSGPRELDQRVTQEIVQAMCRHVMDQSEKHLNASLEPRFD